MNYPLAYRQILETWLNYSKQFQIVVTQNMIIVSYSLISLQLVVLTNSH